MRRCRLLADLGAPVAAKGCSADVVHKSELGLVRLNLRTEQDMRAAFVDIERRLREHGSRFDGVLVEKMVTGRRELMIGARIDPVFGPVVVVGDGGKYVEAMPDVELLLPPFDAAAGAPRVVATAYCTAARGCARRAGHGHRCFQRCGGRRRPDDER